MLINMLIKQISAFQEILPENNAIFADESADVYSQYEIGPCIV